MWSRKLSAFGLEKCAIPQAPGAFCQAERAGTFRILDVYSREVSRPDEGE